MDKGISFFDDGQLSSIVNSYVKLPEWSRGHVVLSMAGV